MLGTAVTYLLSQLPCRGKNQGLSGLEVQLNLLQDGDGKSGCLPSSRLGLGNHVIPCKEHGVGRERRKKVTQQLTGKQPKSQEPDRAKCNRCFCQVGEDLFPQHEPANSHCEEHYAGMNRDSCCPPARCKKATT